MTVQIPIIDMGPALDGDIRAARAVAADIGRALETVGFFQIVGHGVDDELVQAMRDRAYEFFALPIAEKMKVGRPAPGISRGYDPPAQSSLSATKDEVSLPARVDAGAPSTNLAFEFPLRHLPRVYPFRFAIGDLAEPLGFGEVVGAEEHQVAILQARDVDVDEPLAPALGQQGGDGQQAQGRQRRALAHELERVLEAPERVGKLGTDQQDVHGTPPEAAGGGGA